MTGKNKGPAQSNCHIDVKQKDSIFISVIIQNFSNYDCHHFFIRLVDKKKDKAEFSVIPKTNEKYISIRYVCVNFVDSYRFLSSSLDKLVEILVDNCHKSLEYLKKKSWDMIIF